MSWSYYRCRGSYYRCRGYWSYYRCRVAWSYYRCRVAWSYYRCRVSQRGRETIPGNERERDVQASRFLLYFSFLNFGTRRNLEPKDLLPEKPARTSYTQTHTHTHKLCVSLYDLV